MGNASGLGASVYYEDVLPVQWQYLDQEPPSWVVNQVVARNEQLLRMITHWEESQFESKDDSSHSPELQRIENKLNILLDWVVQLVSRDMDVPMPTPVHLSGESVCWHCDELLTEGTWLKVEIYVQAQYPQPLVFFGTVSEAGESELSACIHIKKGHTEGYDKFLFRQHRRAVASKRGGA